jgi:hypothetical protein
VQLASHCYWALVSDTAIVLDARRGEYFALDDVATEIWLRLIAGQPAVSGDDLASGENIGQVARNLGWLEPTDQAGRDQAKRRRKKGRALSPSGAFLCIIRAAILIRYSGFPRAYRWAQSRQAPIAAASDHLPAALKAFGVAELLLVSRLGLEDCLPRSLALFAFLREGGLPVRHCIGVKRYPFTAHAWVESDGVALLQEAGLTESFTTIATIDC